LGANSHILVQVPCLLFPMWRYISCNMLFLNNHHSRRASSYSTSPDRDNNPVDRQTTKECHLCRSGYQAPERCQKPEGLPDRTMICRSAFSLRQSCFISPDSLPLNKTVCGMRGAGCRVQVYLPFHKQAGRSLLL